MFKAFEKPVKLHIADAYSKYGKPVVYDADAIDTETDMFKTLYLIYGTIETQEDVDMELLKSMGCMHPELYNPNEGADLLIGGVWLE
ncbi:MAG: hypothetical protein NC121_03825 [Blautia sp.]|nr:hypothetical protein [Blautia sp.]